MRKIPWFVVAFFIHAFFGGVLTVALCVVALLFLIPLATFQWLG
jgi:hypothetical protein